MRRIIGLLALLTSQWGNAQPSTNAIQWQQSYGGNGLDVLSQIHSTSDHGFIVIGNSDWSVDGNKVSTNYGRDDFWVLRLDATGNKVWEKTFGGSRIEFAGDIQQTADGGFILVGSSNSEADGTKTSSNWGQGDVWVIRLDADGNQLWEQSFGGTNADTATKVVQLPGGGFIIGGSSCGEGGNKDSSTFGSWDYWLIGLDAEGNKLWDRIYGGADEDFLLDMKLSADGGLILSGYSYSAPSGNKTSPLNGVADAWVVRLDATGNKLWEQSIGVELYNYPNSVQETSDGGFVLGGSSGSFELDAWFVRLDGNGNKLWDRTYGGSLTDGMSSVLQLSDGGFLLGCSASSNDGDRVGAIFDNMDYWLIRTDPLGNKQWDLSLGGTNSEYLMNLEQTSDGGFILGGTSYSPTSGNKTSPYFGGIDYWIVKFGPEGPGDSDQDGVTDNQDQCPNTPPGVVVNSHGCSIEQIVPCDGPWKNHGQYVEAVTKTVAAFLKERLVNRRESNTILKEARQSDCGKRSHHNGYDCEQGDDGSKGSDIDRDDRARDGTKSNDSKSRPKLGGHGMRL